MAALEAAGELDGHASYGNEPLPEPRNHEEREWVAYVTRERAVRQLAATEAELVSLDGNVTSFETAAQVLSNQADAEEEAGNPATARAIRERVDELLRRAEHNRARRGHFVDEIERQRRELRKL